MSSIKNIRYCGRIKNEKMKDYYKSASILCCTSDYEGFPNTFLEAWAQGLPIISTIDPDGLIERKGIGTVCKTNEDFINAIEIYRRDLVNYESVAKSARKYFKNSHAEDAAIGKFVESFKTLV
jgi:glycosyltransferase involved in cell wall biosynthesis